MLRTIIIGLLTCLPFLGKANNITYTQFSTEEYSFTLYGGVLPTGTTISSIVWDFDDGTLVSGGSTLNAYHQFINTGTYNVEVSYVKNVNDTITNEIETEVIVVSNLIGSSTCPVAAFLFQNSDWCGTGGLTLSWAFCDQNLGWTADYVVWNMGDGQTKTTQGNSAVVHNYAGVSNVTITAVAYFVGPNGETCSSILMDIPPGTYDPCLVITETTLASSPYLELDVYFAQPDLYINAGDYCQTSSISFFDAGGAFPILNNSGWSYEVFVDGNSTTTSSGLPSNSGTFFQTTLPAGDHLIELVYHNNFIDYPCSVADAMVITVDSCGVDTCGACNAFRPEPDERYWISAWVKETHPSQVKTYTDAHIRLSFTGGTPLDVDFFPTGDIIEGWQRIVGSFTIPVGSTSLDLRMKNNGTTDAFFDDIRFHPFNSSFKSYVYDPETLWLTAELDDNNYATFYEYDQEGQLIRIKKETSRGIMTIQESSSSNPKSE